MNRRAIASCPHCRLVAALCAGYAELVLDIRVPRSRLEGYGALGAGASLSLVGYNRGRAA